MQNAATTGKEEIFETEQRRSVEGLWTTELSRVPFRDETMPADGKKINKNHYDTWSVDLDAVKPYSLPR